MVKRPLWMVIALLLLAAAALWGASRVSWLPSLDAGETNQGGTDGLGTGGISGTGIGDGTDTSPPDLTPLALFALAGLAGAFAVGGWARRVLGALLVLAGGFACARAVSSAGDVDLLTGRGLALAGGLLLAAAGVLVVAFAGRLPTLGSRYQRANAERRPGDPDKDMWDGLSSGEDPTLDGR